MKKVAIVYDWLDSLGGVERMLLSINKAIPDADWYTSYIDKKKAIWTKEISGEIHTSFIQKLPSFIRKNRFLSLPFYPYAFEQFDFSEYDTVLSVTSSFAKGVIIKPNTKHVSIILTPTRWLWGNSKDYGLNKKNSLLKNMMLSRYREWDYVASQRPDELISISKNVSERVKKYYNQESIIIYPPFDKNYWNKFRKPIKSRKSYYIIVSRLEKYKKIDLAIDAFSDMPEKKLIIIGEGREKKELEKMAPSNVSFAYNVDDSTLSYYYQSAKALIMPQEEDFGYVALESQFFDCPVIAYAKGGSLETILKENGLFFKNQKKEDIIEAVEEFELKKYNVLNKKLFESEFSSSLFLEKLSKIIN